MKVLTLLLHDERFSGWAPKDILVRQHFSIEYLSLYKNRGYEPLLYTFHQQVRSSQTYVLNNDSVIKILPVRFRLPPFLRFGNDHNVELVVREMLRDQPDLVHFHNYYLFSFPYISVFVKKRLKRPLIAQLHGYNNHSMRKLFYLPSLLALKNADRILYSYEPERAIYRRLGIIKKAVKLPVPGIDPAIFRPRNRRSTNRMLYVGRLPGPETAYGEKSPLLLIRILKRLLRRSNNVSLDIIGDGPGLQRSRHLTESLGIADHVTFHGYIPHDELPRYYQTSALTFSPIQVYDVDGWFDGSIQESLACGTPVAAFKASAETPLHGTYGFLLSHDTEKAATELEKLLKTPENMDEVAAEGSKFVRKNCSCDRVACKLEDTIEGVT